MILIVTNVNDLQRKKFDETLLIIYSESENAREANEMYDAIKEGGSTRILGHLMRVPASHYFFALSHFRKISITNLFLYLLLITRSHNNTLFLH
jgi:hypothetical protein